jgi:HAD superfamily hydrolase (TIGR01509 family)
VAAAVRELHTVVLDAMGVMYRAADDVADLLVPHVAAHGGDATRVDVEYLRASRGEQTSADFWRSVGLDASNEDAYLIGHAIAPDLIAFLDWARRRDLELACLSNDVSEWSRKLRGRFGLERYITHWLISADVGARKPEARIYEELVARVGREPGSLLLVDDRVKNLDAARRAGLETVLLDPTSRTCDHPRVASLSDLAALLERAWSSPPSPRAGLA